jgi:hypothetical protein
MNTLINAIANEQNVTTTENGASTLISSMNPIVDFFGLGGALRTRTESDVISLFSKAFATNKLTALKVLFYLRDARGGQGERKTFRTCFKWLCENYPDTAWNNFKNVYEFGRFDDLFVAHGTSVWKNILSAIRVNWLRGEHNLMWKWLPSENASSPKTKTLATEIRKYLGVSSKEYRKTLSAQRKALDVVERKMCANEWSDINYKSVPSKAALQYKNAFRKHDEYRYDQYIEDVSSGKTTINASTLYPYDIVGKALHGDKSKTLDVLWNALPNYMEDDTSNGLVVADVSGSMSGRPMEVSISLAMYISERNKGAFKDCFITFAEHPTLEKVIGNNIREKVTNLSRAKWGMSTNLEGVFKLILDTAVKNKVPVEDMPTKLYIVSDMEFNQACDDPSATLFNTIDTKYKRSGYVRPELVFWNVNSRNNQSPVRFNEYGTCLVSGCSPAILTSLLSGKITTPAQVMLNAINVERYSSVVV